MSKKLMTNTKAELLNIIDNLHLEKERLEKRLQRRDEKLKN